MSSASGGWAERGRSSVASAWGWRGHAGGSGGLLKDLSWGGVGGSAELSKLGVGQTGVTIGVDSTDDGEELGLGGVVATGSEEGAEVEGVNAAVVVSVDASVGGEGGEVVSDLKVSLEDVESSLEVDLLLDDLNEVSLDVVWERVEAANSEGWSV